MSARAPMFPRYPGLDRVSYLTNSSMMDVDYLPEHLIVVGGSYVGLEFGQMFRRFGSEVTIVEMGPRLIHREDEDVSTAIREILENESIHIRLDAECIALEKQGDKVAVDLNCSTGDKKSSARTCFSPSAKCPTPTISAWKRPASPSISPVTFRWTISFAPMWRHLRAGRMQRPRSLHTHVLQRL
jgi:hypothetical protein